MSDTVTTAAKVATPTKSAAKKPAARKTAPKTAAKKPAARKAAPRATRKTVQQPSTIQKIVYGQLGMYALIVDGLKDLPGRVDEFVVRGKQVEKDFQKAEQDFRKRVRSYNAKAEIEQAAEGVKQLAEKIKARTSRAA